ncbi:MAG: transcriptional repressor [Planctomycetota bacterium]
MSTSEELQIVERHMRENGFRWTAQRRTIAEVAFGTHEHFNAEELLDMCRQMDPQISRATVYRTLGMLEEAGFVESLDTGAVGGKKYEHVLGHEHHDHMVCVDCGKIVEFHDDDLEARKKQIAIDQGFELVSHNLQMSVRCKTENCPNLQSGSKPGMPSRGPAGQ